MTQPIQSSTTPAADAAAKPAVSASPTITRAMPPVDDRTAADLRTRVGSPNWGSDVRLCHELRSWQISGDLSTSEAAARLSVPHVTSDTFGRLRDFRKPVGVGHCWPELIGYHVDVEVARRAYVQAQAKPSAAAAPAAVTSAAATTAAVTAAKSSALLTPIELRSLMTAVEAEVGHDKTKTQATAHRVKAAAAPYVTKPRETGCGGLAAAFVNLLDPKVTVMHKSKLYNNWYARLAAFYNIARGPTPPGATSSALTHDGAIIARAAVAPGWKSTIVGRPRLLSSGSLAVKIEASMEIGPGHALWGDALAAINASA